MMEKPDTDVLIVGAGPTGLIVATELARRQISCRIIEKRLARSTRSKALGIHARTLELFDLLGLTNKFVKRGYTSPGFTLSAGSRRPLRAGMHQLDSAFPFVLILPQVETETILEAHLNQLGVQVERGVTLTGFEDCGDRVEARTVSGDQEHRISARFMVGADGANSLVRETLGLPFEGSSYVWKAFLGDVMMDGHVVTGGTEQYSNARGLALILPFQDGAVRIITIDRAYQQETDQRELELSELQESTRAILGKPVTLREPRSLSRWGSSLQQVPSYRVGRAFLAGDAAHTHSPAGGQGMNTGIQDAFNLGWKLAQVIQGWSPEALLETFQAERHPVGKRALWMSDLILRGLLVPHQPARSVRDSLFRLFVPRQFVQRRLSHGLSGIGIRYEAPSTAGSSAGTRVPDIELRDATLRPVRLYELLRSSTLTLIIFTLAAQVSEQRAALLRLLKLAEQDKVAPYVVLDAGLSRQHDLGNNVLTDYKGELERKLATRPGTVFMLRPDAYIAFECDLLQEDALMSNWRQWLNPQATA